MKIRRLVKCCWVDRRWTWRWRNIKGCKQLNWTVLCWYVEMEESSLSLSTSWKLSSFDQCSILTWRFRCNGRIDWKFPWWKSFALGSWRKTLKCWFVWNVSQSICEERRYQMSYWYLCHSKSMESCCWIGWKQLYANWRIALEIRSTFDGKK